MNQEILERIKNGRGIFAALDQSGGSTPKALQQYGIVETEYSNDEEMFTLIHEMRTRIMKSPVFNSDSILASILFENTMDRQIDGKFTPDYLLSKGIVPFLKVDKGLADEEDGVQLMKENNNLESVLKRAVERHIFGTKMRSVIKEPNREGIKKIVKQQFEWAKIIISYDLLPIIEPEVSIKAVNKSECEKILKEEILKELANLSENEKVMFKITLPEVDNEYKEIIENEHTIRVVALSGGYTRTEACKKLVRNNGIIACFSRAFIENLTKQQTEEEFNNTLGNSITEIYNASVNK